MLRSEDAGVVLAGGGGGGSTFCFLAAAVRGGLSAAFLLVACLLVDPVLLGVAGAGVGVEDFSTLDFSATFFLAAEAGVFALLAGVFFAAGVLSAAFFLAATMSGVEATFLAGTGVLAAPAAAFFAGVFTEKSDPDEEGSSKS